jgi:NADH:ubiquinone oxidoreductase subunit K
MSAIPLEYFLTVAGVLFSIGCIGFLLRRNLIVLLMSIELMLNAVNLNLVAFSVNVQQVSGQVFALFVITIAAAEVGVGLAIVLLIYRNLKSPDLDRVEQLKG